MSLGPGSAKIRKRRKIIVLAGGNSAERDISLQSGRAVATALREIGHEAWLVDPREIDLQAFDWTGIDLAFVAMHGEFGEDGQLQEVLQELNIPYTGSGPVPSRLAFHKSAAKERFVACDLPTPEAFVVHNSESIKRISSRARQLGFPLVVKPDAQGSSIGVSLLRDISELSTAVALASQHSEFLLIEKAVLGPEWTVPVLGSDPLPPILIETPRHFFDYHAKYTDDETAYIFDAPATPELKQKVSSLAIAACQALGTSGLARVDLRLDDSGNLFLLEINTIPGMTDHSLAPKSAAQAGITFPELCDQMVHLALDGRGRSQPLKPHSSYILHENAAATAAE